MKPRSQNFGPWSTSLDAGSRLHLSAFWKQRLHRLAGLTSARMPRRTLLAAILMAVVVGMSPLVELVPAAPTTAEIKGLGPAGDFVATFSNGVTVELLGLGQNPSAEHAWWKPDGTRLEKRPYHNVMALMKSRGSLAREVCWRWRGVTGDTKTDWGIEPAYNAAGGHIQPKEKQNKSMAGLTARAISLTGSLDTCTVKLSMTVPSSPWQTMVESQAGNASATGKILPDGKILSLQYMRPRADGNDTVVVVGYQASGDIRVIAIDKQRKLHIGKIPHGSISSNGFAMREVRFANVKPEHLKIWQFQNRQRKTETVEFRNVSLHPGKMTDVETVLTTPVERVPATAETGSLLEFGDVVELTINTAGQNQNSQCLINFETGELFAPPEEITSELETLAWITKNGIDAVGSADVPVEGLRGINMIAFPANSEDWNPKRAVLFQVDSAVKHGLPGRYAIMSGAGPLPATHLFKTREGNRGVLQILEIVENKSVKIRYKLQQPE